MRNEDIKELLDAKLTGFKAEIKAVNEMTSLKLDNIHQDVVELKDYQKIQNGRITKIESETKIFRLIHRNPKASIVIIILLIAGLFVLYPILIKIL